MSSAIRQFRRHARLLVPTAVPANKGTTFLPQSDDFPVVIETSTGGADLAAYLRRQRKRAQEILSTHGAALFRGFVVREPDHFFKAIAEVEPDILSYSERSSPRHAVSDRVYTSTDHPADQDIVLHSEQSYTYDWPCYICFFCHTKAATGGKTPIADNRQILKRLPDPLIARFEQHGVLYQRTYTPQLGVSWRTAFQTESRAEVETFCRERDIEFTWEADGCLKTRQVRSAFQHHPVTGEKLWFNHALFFHVTSLEERITRALVEAVGYDNVPTNTFFGNGEPFLDSDISAMRQAVAAQERRFDWQEGDVLMLDNMICQHGRDPFSGERRVLTIMTRRYQSLRAPLMAPGRACSHATSLGR